MKPILAILTLALAGCATTGTDTAKLSATLAVVHYGTSKAIGDGKEILSDLQRAERDAKEIRRLLK
jgi:hypothetical protein